MTHLYEYLDGSDETILRYIEDCSTTAEYASKPGSVTLCVDTADDLIALHGWTVDGLSFARREFVRACEDARSSDAKYLAYRFKHLSKLRIDTVRLALELYGTAWVQRMGW